MLWTQTFLFEVMKKMELIMMINVKYNLQHGDVKTILKMSHSFGVVNQISIHLFLKKNNANQNLNMHFVEINSKL